MAGLGLQGLADSNTARLASYLLLFIARSRHNLPQEEGDDDRVDWLIAQLIASRRGAMAIAPRNGGTGEAEGVLPDEHTEIKTTFSNEQELYRMFARYSHNMTDPVAHALWVDDLVSTLRSLVDDGWQELEPAQRDVVKQTIEPLLRKLRELNGQSLDRESPFASV